VLVGQALMQVLPLSCSFVLMVFFFWHWSFPLPIDQFDFDCGFRLIDRELCLFGIRRPHPLFGIIGGSVAFDRNPHLIEIHLSVHVFILEYEDGVDPMREVFENSLGAQRPGVDLGLSTVFESRIRVRRIFPFALRRPITFTVSVEVICAGAGLGCACAASRLAEAASSAQQSRNVPANRSDLKRVFIISVSFVKVGSQKICFFSGA
jgi:hypothetical protein